MFDAKFMRLLWGSLKSKLMWFGGFLILSPVWWPEVEPYFSDLWGPEHAAKAAMIVGFITVLLRAVTSQSLAQKGMPKPTPKPPKVDPKVGL